MRFVIKIGRGFPPGHTMTSQDEAKPSSTSNVVQSSGFHRVSSDCIVSVSQILLFAEVGNLAGSCRLLAGMCSLRLKGQTSASLLRRQVFIIPAKSQSQQHFWKAALNSVLSQLSGSALRVLRIFLEGHKMNLRAVFENCRLLQECSVHPRSRAEFCSSGRDLSGLAKLEHLTTLHGLTCPSDALPTVMSLCPALTSLQYNAGDEKAWQPIKWSALSCISPSLISLGVRCVEITPSSLDFPKLTKLALIVNSQSKPLEATFFSGFCALLSLSIDSRGDVPLDPIAAVPLLEVLRLECLSSTVSISSACPGFLNLRKLILNASVGVIKPEAFSASSSSPFPALTELDFSPFNSSCYVASPAVQQFLELTSNVNTLVCRQDSVLRLLQNNASLLPNLRTVRSNSSKTQSFSRASVQVVQVSKLSDEPFEYPRV